MKMQLCLFNYSEHLDNNYFDNDNWVFTKRIYWSFTYRDGTNNTNRDKRVFFPLRLQRFGSRKLFNNFKQGE